MMKWFDKSKLHTVAELRAEYKRLLVKYHPDNGGKVSDMQEINSEYGALYAILTQKKSADEESSTEQESAADEAFREVLEKIINYDIEIQIIGDWIWCFNSYQYRSQLKELNFQYAPKKRAWTWHAEPYRRHHKKEIPLSHIKAKYGCETVRNKSYQYSLD
ncbi:hypothetical protein AALB51_20420 [Lachnospiraceae bacterium 62-26]